MLATGQKSILPLKMNQLSSDTVMKIIPLAALLILSSMAASATAKTGSDPSVAARLDAQGIKYVIDDDGDYKLTYSYSKENRSQLVFVSSGTEEVAGIQVREIYSPAARVEKDSIKGSRAFQLLEESSTQKLGSWEVSGDVLFFAIKLPEPISAEQLVKATNIAAEVADDKEIELSGRDDL